MPRVRHVETEDMAVDMLTEQLGKNTLPTHRDFLTADLGQLRSRGRVIIPPSFVVVNSRTCLPA